MCIKYQVQRSGTSILSTLVTSTTDGSLWYTGGNLWFANDNLSTGYAFSMLYMLCYFQEMFNLLLAIRSNSLFRVLAC